MLVNFTKMHGLGNDFVVIDLITQTLKLRSAEIKRLCDRHSGVGCDQLLLIEPPMRPNADFSCRIINASGQEAEQCGNGLRCAVRFFYDMGFTNNTTIEVDCLAGACTCTLEKDGTITVNMGVPLFNPEAIPFISDPTHEEALLHSIFHEEIEYKVSVLSIGNPHAIIPVADLEAVPMKKIGKPLSTHACFPNEANIGFLQIIDRTRARLRVYERGVGETLACGSSACAAVISGIRLGLLDHQVDILFPRGKLHIQWGGPNQPVYMRGPVNSVYLGRFRV